MTQEATSAPQIKVGNVEIAVARDGYWEAAPISHLRDIRNEEIPQEEFTDGLQGGDPTKVIPSRVLCFVVRDQGKTILHEAGVGAWGLWRFGDGHLLDSLNALGVDPEEIDYVVPSHLHGDHLGWNTRPGPDGEPVPTFPNARYLFQQLDWDHFTHPDHPRANSETVKKTLLPIRDAGLMDLVGAETHITEHVSLLHTPGHTPGSVSLMVQSDGEAAIFIGDAAHLCLQLTEVEWSPQYEVDREESARSRLKIVEEAVGKNALVSGSHLDEGPVFGRMVMMNGRRFWQGVDL